jgi:hypothetical protein
MAAMPQPPRTATVALLVLLAACGGESTAEFDPTAPLTALPPCESPPPPADAEPPAGLAFPEGAYIVQVTPQDPLVNVVGWVPMTPIQVRMDYEAREDLHLILNEDEVFEAELLVSDGTHRTYLKANAACDRGSNLLAVVAPEVDADGLPVPSGGGTTTGG